MRSKIRVNYEKEIDEIQDAARKAIDEVCKKHNYKLTYAQINSALNNLITSNLRRVTSFEIKHLRGGDEEE